MNKKRINKSDLLQMIDLFKESFELIGLTTFVSLIDEFKRGNLLFDEVIERIMEWNSEFGLSDFLKKNNQKVRSEAVKLGNSYYSTSGIISLGTDSVYDLKECRSKFRIILNPTTSEIIKLLYANVPIMIFDNEEDRDYELSYLLDKLNLIGIRHIKLK